MRRFVISAFIVALVLFILVIGAGLNFLFPWGGGFVAGDSVAVLRIDGVILDSGVYLESISSIARDDGIKALVIRIDSPGGAVGPSQEIYAEVKRLAEKIPVVASIGTVGASGGYYIACAAGKIFANPGAITGSIGVIAQFMSYRELLAWAKLDIEVIKSGEFKDVGSPFREMTAAERSYVQGLIDNTHSQFKGVVSKARGLKSEGLDRVADGRIFTGEQAKEAGLVDELGTLGDAVREAAALSGVDATDPDMVYYPKPKMRFIDYFISSARSYAPSNRIFTEKFGLFYLVDVMR
ncbi:MAG: signal peptide peptidase SppA [Deltaproteobacteria bacterium]